MNFNNFQTHSIPKGSIIFIPIYFIFESFSGYMFDKNGLVSYLFGSFWVLYFIFMYFKTGISKQNFPIIVFLLYLLVKVLMSSNILTSINQYATLFIAMSVFPVAFKYFNNFKGFIIISKISFLFLIFYLLNLVISNFFLESSFKGYFLENDETVWHTGNIFTNGLNSVAFLSVAAPIIIPFIRRKRQKKLYIILLIIAIVTVLISFKRVSILAIPTGYMVILFLNRDLIKTSKYIILMLFFLIVTFTMYSNIIEQQFQAREQTFTRTISYEPRYVETILVWNQALSFSSISESLFGKELFNSVNNYGLTIDKKRMIHVDYNQLLHGAGFLGLFWYLYIHLYLIRKMRLYSSNSHYLNQILSNSTDDKKVFFKYSSSIFYAFIIVSLFLSLGGGFHLVLFNAIKYLFLGSILGIWYNVYTNKNNLLKDVEI